MATPILPQTTRVAIYARVSTTGQGQDVTMQTRELQKYAEARGFGRSLANTLTKAFLARRIRGPNLIG
jgi:predicted site-specific integrase-resolvase